jgi:hypothetical protein
LLVGAVLISTLSVRAADREGALPDLVEEDETGGILDEFALLEEELSIDVVESASKHRQSIFWSSPSSLKTTSAHRGPMIFPTSCGGFRFFRERDRSSTSCA